MTHASFSLTSVITIVHCRRCLLPGKLKDAAGTAVCAAKAAAFAATAPSLSLFPPCLPERRDVAAAAAAAAATAATAVVAVVVAVVVVALVGVEPVAACMVWFGLSLSIVATATVAVCSYIVDEDCHSFAREKHTGSEGGGGGVYE
jgi:hypothetical protein